MNLEFDKTEIDSSDENLATKKERKKVSNKEIIKRLTLDGAFAAITVVLYIFFKVKIAIFPNFLDLNFSMIPVIICAFMLGPWDAAILVIIRFLIKLPMSSTGMVGEAADLFIGILSCIPAGLLYKYGKFKGKTVLAFASVVIMWVLAGILSNIIINVPWYTQFYFHENYYETGPAQALIGMCNDAFELITFGNGVELTKENFMFYYTFLAVIPFNLLLSITVVLMTALVHKKLKTLYDMI